MKKMSKKVLSFSLIHVIFLLTVANSNLHFTFLGQFINLLHNPSLNIIKAAIFQK